VGYLLPDSSLAFVRLEFSLEVRIHNAAKLLATNDSNSRFLFD
jgi:hypothetical protein